jgi:hypothetical protein
VHWQVKAAVGDRMLLTTGEHEYTRYGYRQLLERTACDVLQPDISWVGGITDCVARMKNGKLAVIDFKSSKDAYFGQFVQAAGYALQCEENGAYDAEGNKLDVSIDSVGVLYVVPFGSADPTPREQFDVEGFKLNFEHAVNRFKAGDLGATDPVQRLTGFEALESLFGVSAETARAAAVLSAVVGDERTQALIEELAIADAVNSGESMAMGPRIRER